ncbi:MAG TPA: carboxypeptidase-like regulatory domain-containing protein [Alphaproteobacteria bacterium]|nr:carboxypeptidase-like regulatory domain-containing protein [Alphaproteobacteria bacterium]
MEKGLGKLATYSIAAIMFSLMIILLSGNASAYDCTDGYSPTECVCGHTPNSALGYGQVIIGMNVYSCNNIQDNICPEDFTNGSQVGNCSSCPDYDCASGGSTPPPSGSIGYFFGYVRDKDGSPIDRAIVEGHPVKWDPDADLDRNATTSASGYFISDDFITGTYFFSATKDGYDTQLVEATITRGVNTSVNFTLQDGTCHEDCTNSYNRCNAACDGVTFGDGTSSCQFYDNEVKLLCANREKGTQVKLSGGGNATHAYFVDCCEGAPELKYYAKVQADTSANTKNIIKIEKIAKYNDVPVRVIISYWQDE